VVAQVEAGDLAAEEAERQHLADERPCLAQLGDERLAVAARAKGVDEDAAGHAALDGTLERLDEPGGGLVIREDVVEQVHM
jgi:hypothetical protein